MRDDVARVLVVDDDDLLVDELRRLLVADGYSVTTAMQRSEALQALAEADWQVVVLDLKLEGPLGPDHGLELIADVRLRAPAARIVLLTAYATPSNIERAFAEGIYDFIQKEGPFGFLLRAKVRRAIDAERDRRLLALQSDERERRLGEV
ncbi:MAG: response regulator, partial [Myxococcales bacterium]|nr:response regulator [Myxococcales bacterium]